MLAWLSGIFILSFDAAGKTDQHHFMKTNDPADPTVIDVAHNVLDDRTRDMKRLWPRVLAGADREALHDLRVNVRRIQAVLRLFRDELPKRRRDHAATAKRLIRSLGAVREIDVVLMHLDDVMKPGEGDDRAIRWLRAVCSVERDDRQQALRRVMQDTGWPDELRSWIRDQKAKGSVRKHSPAEFRTTVQKLVPVLAHRYLGHIDNVVGHPRRSSALHEMRLDGKPFRYLLEFCSPFFGDDLSRLLAEVKGSLTLLGQIHECDVLVPLIRRQIRIVQKFNRSVSVRRSRIPTEPLQSLVRRERSRRQAMFQDLSQRFSPSEKTRIASMIARAMRHPSFS